MQNVKTLQFSNFHKTGTGFPNSLSQFFNTFYFKRCLYVMLLVFKKNYLKEFALYCHVPFHQFLCLCYSLLCLKIESKDFKAGILSFCGYFFNS